MDNLSCHKTKKLIKYYVENKINVVFNSPYVSKFNSVELAFRTIKYNLYKSFFKSINEMEERVKAIIEDENFSKTLLYNFAETLGYYLKFIYYFRNKNINKMNLH